MGSLLGLTFGVGVVLAWQGLTTPPRPPARRARLAGRARELFAQAGIDGVSPAGLAGSSSALGLLAGLFVALGSGSIVIAVVFALMAAAVPTSVVRMRARRREAELREVWPDVVDDLASAVRAGMSLPEALTQLGVRGPTALREAFARFGDDYRATGRFAECLDLLKHRLADPVGDRVIEALRLARDVGGSDLGRLLRTLSAFLRDDARTRAELEARQSWTVNSARLAVAAPWILLAVLATRRDAVRAFDTPAGAVLLAAGATVCLLAYRLMTRLGRLPRERRVLR